MTTKGHPLSKRSLEGGRMRHLSRRIGFYLVALWASVTLNFLIPRLTPGNPAGSMMARLHGRVSPQSLHALEIAFGITHDPLWSQYLQYLNNLLHGDLGISITYYPTPVAPVIAPEIPRTLMLVHLSLLISFVLGTLLGVLVAWRRNSTLHSLFSPLFTFFSPTPYFC